MSVLTDHRASDFFLAKDDEAAALVSMKAFVARKPTATEYVLEPDALEAAEDMVAALASAGFEAARDDDGNLVSLEWTGDRLPYDVETLRSLLTSFTRFVKAGSSLELEENGERCVFAFQQTHVKLTRDDEYYAEVESAFGDAEDFYEAGDLATALPIYEAVIALFGDATDSRQYELAWTRRLWILFKLERWDELVRVSAVAPESQRSCPTDSLTALAGENDAAFAALLEAILTADPTNEIALEYRRTRG